MIFAQNKRHAEFILERFNKLYPRLKGTFAQRVNIDNIRRIMSSFFTWLEDENYILKSPVRRIHKIRSNKTVKETYTDEALECV